MDSITLKKMDILNKAMKERGLSTKRFTELERTLSQTSITKLRRLIGEFEFQDGKKRYDEKAGKKKKKNVFSKTQEK